MQMLQQQHQQRQQANTQQQQQQQHQLPGAAPSISFAPEADGNTEGEPSRRSKRGAPVWARKQQVIEQINELIDELDEIDANIALQVCTCC